MGHRGGGQRKGPPFLLRPLMVFGLGQSEDTVKRPVHQHGHSDARLNRHGLGPWPDVTRDICLQIARLYGFQTLRRQSGHTLAHWDDGHDLDDMRRQSDLGCQLQLAVRGVQEVQSPRLAVVLLEGGLQMVLRAHGIKKRH
jgi:hypothetical protein